MIDRGILPLRENYTPYKAIDFLLLLYYQKKSALEDIKLSATVAVGAEMIKKVLEDYQRVKYRWAEEEREPITSTERSIKLMEKIMQKKGEKAKKSITRRL